MVELLKKGDNLDCDSLMTLGKAYYWAKDRDKAIHYFELAAKDVNTAPMALYNLGFVYSNQGNIKGFKRDMGKAIEYYSNSTNLGDSHAQRDLGLIYMDDSTNELHKSAGLDYLIKAAIKGDFLAKMQLAEKLAHGKGVPQNYVLAYAIVERWASRDNKNIDLRSYIYNKMTSYEYSEAISLSKNEKEIFSLLQ